MAGRVDTGSRQRKTPRGNLGDEGRLAYLLTVAGEGREEHKGNEESTKEKISQSTE
jgi:hypothetical protein